MVRLLELFGDGCDPRPRILELGLRGGHGVARRVQLALGECAALDQALGSRGLASGDAERLFRRPDRRLRGLVGIAERLIFNPDEQGATPDLLPFRDRDLQDRSADFGADGRVLVRHQRA